MADVPRCIECGAPLKAVPSWLAGARVNFTCSACPKRAARAGAARIEPIIEDRSIRVADPDADIEPDVVVDIDEDSDLDQGAEDIDDAVDDKDL